MPNFVLDTGIVLGYLKRAPYAEEIEATLKPFDHPNTALTCIVSHGEILSIALQRQWPAPRKEKLNDLLVTIPAINISHREVLDSYAEIDAFSQGKFTSKPLPSGMSSRNMGKNDLWIAAVAHQTKATLLTTDKDFDHLDGIYFDVKWYDPHKK
jgi:predicted nucleic acid-binding protein